MKKTLKNLLKLFCGALTVSAIAAAVIIAVYKFQTSPPVDLSSEAVELTDYGSEYKYQFSLLSNEEKHAYNLILKEIYSMPDEIIINRVDSEMTDRIFHALMNDNPDLFFIGRKCFIRSTGIETKFSVEYIIEKDEYQRMKKELDDACERALKSLTNLDDPWQTELEIHDYIIDRCAYSLEDELVGATAYGALVEGKAACEGYSKAAKLLLDKVGIRSFLIGGNAEDKDGNISPHMWNIVTLGNEDYHLDCTWDDPINQNGVQTKTYIYFNLDTATISSTHSDFSLEVECNSDKENYFVKTGTYFKEYSRDFEKKLAQTVAKDMDAGKDASYFRFASKESYNKAVEDLLGNQRIYRVLAMAQAEANAKFSTSSTGYSTDDSRLILVIAPKTEN